MYEDTPGRHRRPPLDTTGHHLGWRGLGTKICVRYLQARQAFKLSEKRADGDRPAGRRQPALHRRQLHRAGAGGPACRARGADHGVASAAARLQEVIFPGMAVEFDSLPTDARKRINELIRSMRSRG